MIKHIDYQQKCFTYYTPLYEELIPHDNFFRRVKENIDFSFVNKMLRKSYSEELGRPADEPEKLFKLLFIQKLKGFSDREVIEECKYNMVYKYFLDLNPEDKLVDYSLLSVFRRTRINNEEMLEEMLNELLRQGIQKGIIKSNTLIVDATHTKSSATKESKRDQLRRLTRNLRKAVYKTNYNLSELFPKKPDDFADIQAEIKYSDELIEALSNKKDDLNSTIEKELQRVKAFLETSPKSDYSQSVVDPDAKTGYKSKENSFFGYKTHIAMTDDRFISALEVTSGEAGDGKLLPKLIEKSKKAGIEVKEVLGDCAYGGKDNLEYLKEKEITAYMKLNPLVTDSQRKTDLGMVYNKDAGAMQCRAGHLSIKSKVHQNKGCNRNPRTIYWFDVEKCKSCLLQEGCYKKGTKTRSYCETLKCETHWKHAEFQETDEFKNRIKDRYKIEAKNGEMKSSHGLGTCTYRGLFGMQLQSYFTAITVNIKRMIKILASQMCEIS